MLPRHEVPTHLHVEDRVFFGFMTVRHVLVLAGGGLLCLGMALSPPFPLPEMLRYLLAMAIAGAALAIAFVEPDGRHMEDWLMAVARYLLSPRVAVWRPLPETWETGEEKAGVLVLSEGGRGVVSPPPGGRGGGPAWTARPDFADRHRGSSERLTVRR